MIVYEVRLFICQILLSWIVRILPVTRSAEADAWSAGVLSLVNDVTEAQKTGVYYRPGQGI